MGMGMGIIYKIPPILGIKLKPEAFGGFWRLLTVVSSHD